MDLLRRHLFFIVCGVAAAGGGTLAVTGLRAMPEVLTAMEEAEDLYQKLKHLKTNPVNQQTIEAQQRRIDLVKQDFAKVLARAKELYNYKLLIDGVLPDGDKEARYEFRNRYAAAMRELMDSLVWGGPATKALIDEMGDRIEEERFQEQEHGLDEDTVEALSHEAGPTETLAGVLTAEGIRKSALARANVRAAQQIFCYAVDFGESGARDQVPSLYFDIYMQEAGGIEAPELGDIWRAQLGYWIQKDVVEAIVAVNAEAAAKVDRDARWVGIMPVKDVISIRFIDEPVPPLQPGEDGPYGGTPGGYGEAYPPGTAEMVFTGSGSIAEYYDVIQFSVKLVMDQRDIPRLIERLCANRFHTPLRIAYRAVPVNRKMENRVYGPEPTVNVVMDFETILLTDVFGPLKPEEREDEG